MEYDALGQLKKKGVGTNPSNTAQSLETLKFDYNIRGWLLGMNRADVLDANGGSNYRFGYDLGYDKTINAAGRTYTTSQYNGNITGMIWKSAGDGIRRKYDYTYDAANRLLQGLFEQNNPDNTWGSGTVDYKMKMGDGLNPDSAYDYNGNIKRMQQWGLKLTTSSQIDDLEYNYFASSNRLKNVRDVVNDTATKLGDFRSSKAYITSLGGSKTSSATDYSYDSNGNLTQDLNKDITSNTYNFLNLPNVITTTLGTVTFTYDASGNKIKKTVAETGKPSKTTLYIAGAVYEDDVLQFIGHEEGRIRNDSGDFYFDYFLKDHLGNVRMVLTEEQKVDAYPAATMEVADSTVENTFYSNLSATRASKPWGYPTDNYTSPNDKVAALRGQDNKIGPAIVLKVIAGDKFNVRVSSWYTNFLYSNPDNSYILTDLLNVLTAGVSSSGGKGTTSQISGTGALNTAVSLFLDDQELAASTTKPMAFLNWILFDEQFKIVETSSGFDQVGTEDQLTVHQFNNLPIDKNGYLYVYVSNASQDDMVYFDNLQVTHTRSPILEETHYYPFGLTMAGISSKAAGIMSNKKQKFQNQEYNQDLGINYYEFKYRNHDPQMGRFIQIDPLAEDYLHNSTYAFSENKVTVHVELEGLEAEYIFKQFWDEVEREFQTLANQIDRAWSASAEVSTKTDHKSTKVGTLTTTNSTKVTNTTTVKSNVGGIMNQLITHNTLEGSNEPLFNIKHTTDVSYEQKTEVKTSKGTITNTTSVSQSGTVKNKGEVGAQRGPVKLTASGSKDNENKKEIGVQASVGTTKKANVKVSASNSNDGNMLRIGAGVESKNGKTTTSFSIGFNINLFLQ